jgi:hypothetical protein
MFVCVDEKDHFGGSLAASTTLSQRVLDFDLIANGAAQTIFLVRAEFDSVLGADFLLYRFHNIVLYFEHKTLALLLS